MALDLSVVLPGYNAAYNLEKMVLAASSFFQKHHILGEIIFVDDGSTDETSALLPSLQRQTPSLKVLRHPSNRGKGAAVRTGVLHASGEKILFLDSDMPYLFDSVPHALEQEADIIIGSRVLPESRFIVSRKRLPLIYLRHLMGRALNLYVRLLLQVRCTDTQVGFKLFSRRAAQMLFPSLTRTGFSFDIELLYLAQQHQLSLLEVPVTIEDNSRSTVRLWRDSLLFFWDVLMIRLNGLRGAYDE